MKIDLTCPIEIRGYELTCDEEGSARAYIKMNNLAAHPIARFDAVACWSNSATGQSEAQSFRIDRFHADARAEFDFTLSAFAVPHADTLEIHFSRVRFSDGAADWIGGQTECVSIDELPVLPAAEARLLAETAGEDAVRYPEAHEKHWLCVCGRANFLHQDTCSRCERSKDEVFGHYDREHLLQMMPQAETVAPADEDDEEEWTLEEALHRFRYQREILLRRTMTMGLIIVLLLGFSAVSGYHKRVEEARRTPPTLLSVSANQP